MKTCETCRFWDQQQLLVEYDSIKNVVAKIAEVDKDDIKVKIDYGECTKAISKYSPRGRKKNYSIKELVEKNVSMFTEDSEGYGGAWLYTHKDHFCKCWESKNGTSLGRKVKKK